MNQYKQLVKKTTHLGVVAAGIVAVFGGIYVGVSMFGDTLAKQKTEAESKLAQETGRLNGLRTQIQKSGQAEEHYALLLQRHTSTTFSMDQEAMYSWLKEAAKQYRLGTFKFKREAEVDTAKPDLLQLNYRISLRKPIRLEFLALSDMHVFSFIDALQKAAPGLVVIQNVELKRRGDIKPEVLANIGSGVTPLLVEASVAFTWVGVSSTVKEGAAPGAQPNVGNPETSSMPGGM